MWIKKIFATIILLTLIFATANSSDWSLTLGKAKGQTIYFNAWGGSDAINRYIQWAADQAERRFGISVKHVKVDDAAAVVARILAEKTAGRQTDGSVDLIWVNGENFRTLKNQGLLLPPWTQELPAYKYVDTEGKPTTTIDFGEPVDHLEAPWGMAQLVFMHDKAILPNPPKSMLALADYAALNPGRVSYPKPPNFHGTTFIKQALLELSTDQQVLLKPADQTDVRSVTAPLWQFLDELHPLLWRKGQNFPVDGPALRQLLDDGEIDIALSFNPSEASRAIADGQLNETVRTYIHKQGTIGNTHFVTIPFNSSAIEAAKVFANFLMSAEAQAKKSDPAVWGDPTVLAISQLDEEGKSFFADIPLGIATLSAEELSPTLPEPHASWVDILESEWQKRYGQ